MKFKYLNWKLIVIFIIVEASVLTVALNCVNEFPDTIDKCCGLTLMMQVVSTIAIVLIYGFFTDEFDDLLYI